MTPFIPSTSTFTTTATTPPPSIGPVLDPLTLARGAAAQVAAAEQAITSLDVATLPGEDLPPLVVRARAAVSDSRLALARLSTALSQHEATQRPPAPQGYVYFDEWVRAWQAWERAGGDTQPNWRESQPSRVFQECDEYLPPNAPIPLIKMDRTHGYYWFVRLWDNALAPWYIRVTSDCADEPEPDCWDGATNFYTEDEALTLYADIYGKGM